MHKLYCQQCIKYITDWINPSKYVLQTWISYLLSLLRWFVNHIKTIYDFLKSLIVFFFFLNILDASFFAQSCLSTSPRSCKKSSVPINICMYVCCLTMQFWCITEKDTHAYMERLLDEFKRYLTHGIIVNCSPTIYIAVDAVNVTVVSWV